MRPHCDTLVATGKARFSMREHRRPHWFAHLGINHGWTPNPDRCMRAACELCKNMPCRLGLPSAPAVSA